jgi:hypothetical protein
MKTKTLTCYELEQAVLTYLEQNPRSSIAEISKALDWDYNSIYSLVEGRKNSRSMTGLVSAGILRAKPGINTDNNRLCWVYELVI